MNKQIYLPTKDILKEGENIKYKKKQCPKEEKQT